MRRTFPYERWGTVQNLGGPRPQILTPVEVGLGQIGPRPEVGGWRLSREGHSAQQPSGSTAAPVAGAPAADRAVPDGRPAWLRGPAAALRCVPLHLLPRSKTKLIWLILWSVLALVVQTKHSNCICKTARRVVSSAKWSGSLGGGRKTKKSIFQL